MHASFADTQKEFLRPTSSYDKRLIITCQLPGIEVDIPKRQLGEARLINEKENGSLTTVQASNQEVQDEPPQATNASSSERIVVVLGPMPPEPDAFRSKINSNSPVYAKAAATLTEFQTQLGEILKAEGYHKELLLFHLLLTDNENAPIIGGKYVLETDLYGALFDNCLNKVSVIQIVKRVPKLASPKPTVLLEHVTHHDGCQTQPPNNENRQPGMPDSHYGDDGMYFYLLEITGKNDWNRVFNALDSVVAELQHKPGLTAETAVSQLTSACPDVKLISKSGIPKRRVMNWPEIPECLDFNEKQPQLSENAPKIEMFSKGKSHQDSPQMKSVAELPLHVVQEVSNSQESVPLETFSEEQPATQQPAEVPVILPEHPLMDVENKFAEENQKSVSIGIIISVYETTKERTEYSNRIGAEKDNDLIYRISQRVQCSSEDINLPFSGTAEVTKDKIKAYLKNFAIKHKDMKLHQIFLFVSAHGTKSGLVTSKEEIVSLEELLQPLSPLAKHVVVFYQPCRGPLKHSPGSAVVLSGVSFTSEDTAGSCLPASMANCSVVYGTVPLYASYHAEMGSPMLFALHEAVYKDELAGKVIRLENLANMTQNNMLCLLREVFNKFEFVQFLQYTVRDNWSIQIGVEMNPTAEKLTKKIPDDFMQPFKIRL